MPISIRERSCGTASKPQELKLAVAKQRSSLMAMLCAQKGRPSPTQVLEKDVRHQSMTAIGETRGYTALLNRRATQALPCSRYSCRVISFCSRIAGSLAMRAPPSHVDLIGLFVSLINICIDSLRGLLDTNKAFGRRQLPYFRLSDHQ